MFKNPDFKGVPNLCMGIAVTIMYDTLYSFSKILNISWVDISLSSKGPYSPPSIERGITDIVLLSLLLIPALYISIKRCYKRIKNEEIQPQKAIKEYATSLAEFGVVFILLIIIAPIIMPYLRGWK